MSDAAASVRDYLTRHEIDHEELAEGVFSLTLPGEKKLQIPVRIDVGPHALGVHAFVCRRPDENHERVYRWLLERNLKLYGVAFALDAVGDIYLDARLPLAAVADDDLRARLGAGALQQARLFSWEATAEATLEVYQRARSSLAAAVS